MFKYRGKDLMTNNWVYGHYSTHQGLHVITGADDTFAEIDGKTLGVSWGQKDSQGKDIFTGNNIKVEMTDWNTGKVIVEEVREVQFKDGKFGIDWGEFQPVFTALTDFNPAVTKFTVVGNKWEDAHEGD